MLPWIWSQITDIRRPDPDIFQVEAMLIPLAYPGQAVRIVDGMMAFGHVLTSTL